MRRQIKFRAWLKFRHRMVDVVEINFSEGYIVWIDDDHIGHEQIKEVGKFEDVILMQYTDTKDRNGNEIYEGDIVSFLGIQWDGPNGDRVDYVGIVRYSDEHTSFNFEISDVMLAMTFEAEDVEVIGNIYANPGLLEVKDGS